MRRRVCAAAMLVAMMAGAATAQQDVPDPLPDRSPPKREPRGARPLHPPGPRLFISPSGEPFRGEDGFGAWLAQADTNHDGAVSLEEFQADAARFFAVIDTDHNGVVDGFEIQAYERERVPEIQNMNLDPGPGGARGGGGRSGGREGGGGHRGGGEGGESGGMGGRGAGRGGGGMGGPRGGGERDVASAPTGAPATPHAGREGAARYSLLNEPQPVSGADANLDGKITPDEWARAAIKRFNILDKAKTGRLTRDSLLRPPGSNKGSADKTDANTG